MLYLIALNADLINTNSDLVYVLNESIIMSIILTDVELKKLIKEC